MTVSVVLEQLNDNAFRATAFAPAPVVVEASTRQQAVAQIREMIRDRLSRVEVIQIDVPGKEDARDPWEALIGAWVGNPDAAEIEENIADYRREVDASPGLL